MAKSDISDFLPLLVLKVFYAQKFSGSIARIITNMSY